VGNGRSSREYVAGNLELCCLRGLWVKGEELERGNHTKLIQQAYQSIKAADIPSFLNLLAENVLWIVPEMTNVPFAGTWQGREQAGQFFSRMVEVQDVVEFEPEEFIAQRNNVVVLGHFTMHVRATGRTSPPIGYTFGKWKEAKSATCASSWTHSPSAEPIAQHR